MLTRHTLFGFCLAALGTTAACGPLEGDELAKDPYGAIAQPVVHKETCRGAPYPVILAHGMAGWEKVGPVNYFFNVASDLRARGETVVESQVPPFESSAVRGGYLAAVIDDTLKRTGACKVNLIAHSQGGLDGRYVISTMHYGDRVASLTTVSTPHRGTPIADAALGLVPGIADDVIDAILDLLYGSVAHAPGAPDIRASLGQFTRDNMLRHFNPGNPNDARVKYYSVAGRSAARVAASECAGGVWTNSTRLDLLDPLLLLPSTVFAFTSANPLFPDPNDGLVSIESAKWGTFLGCIPGDHLDEIGQLLHLFPDALSGFNHREMYRKITLQLHSDGF